MTSISAVALALLMAAETPWIVKDKDDNLILANRERAGSPIQEWRAEGLIDANVDVTWRILNDFPNYKAITPFAETVEVRDVEKETGAVHIYVVMNPPMISKRDYCARFIKKDGMVLAWKTSEKAPPQKDGVVRMPLVEGEWRLEPRDGGRRTYAVYQLAAHPGGSIPNFMANRIASKRLRDTFDLLRKAAVSAR